MTQTAPQPLTDEALHVLTVAAASDGVIMMLRHMGGTTIQAGRQAMCDPKDRRAVARWEAALEELISFGFVKDRTGKREVYFVTDAGYRFVEKVGGAP